LNDLYANVVGLGLDPISTPSHFQLAEISNLISDYRIDINNHINIERLVDRVQPDFVFHLAAQALVRKGGVLNFV
jgi:CDP-glucose 4,6-dehydratase